MDIDGSQQYASAFKFPGNLFGARRPSPSAADKNEAKNDSWLEFGRGARQQFLEAVPDQMQLDASLDNYLQQQLQNQADAAACPSCSCSSSAGNAAGSGLQQLYTREVAVVASSAFVSIQVPRFKCNRCSGKPFNLDPFKADFLENPLRRYQPQRAPLVIHSTSIDGLMRVGHLRNAGTATSHSNPAQFRMVPQPFSDAFGTFAAPTSRKSSGACHSFNADKAAGRESKTYDINGIVYAFCRHGFILAAVNMPVGERWAYAICLLHILMCVHNVWPFMNLYDINCRWGRHFRQFVENTSGWHPALQAWALAMALPLPPFHIKMHSADCAERNSMKTVDGAGRGSGEMHEVCNRYLGQSGQPLQYAAKPIRELWLEALMLAW
ncbi:hypothetical protein OEZ85_000367 [Tetradesmus obliquus]|uniref:Uncharacterized protein n=1 Tax=Tetradesmus obliquus TaxID=3088 RepID=A0ABY8UQE9_TETOB|nr:hypothetical protein OEZ85_000367 [Tetradesmus obliquus]